VRRIEVNARPFARVKPSWARRASPPPPLAPAVPRFALLMARDAASEERLELHCRGSPAPPPRRRRARPAPRRRGPGAARRGGQLRRSGLKPFLARRQGGGRRGWALASTPWRSSPPLRSWPRGRPRRRRVALAAVDAVGLEPLLARRRGGRG